MFFHSSAKAKQQAATRERHLGKIRAEFELIERNLGKYSLKTAEIIRRRLEQARGKYTEGKLFQYTLTEQAAKFQLQWHIEGNPGYVFRAQRIHSLYQPGIGDPR